MQDKELGASRIGGEVQRTSRVEGSIVGFTGTRERLPGAQVSSLIAWVQSRPRGVLHHGDCVGADTAAHATFLFHGWSIEAHPTGGQFRAHNVSASKTHPLKSPLERNADIVAAADELLACPSGPEIVRSGTWSTIRKARAKGILRTIIWPDGSVTVEPGEREGGK